MNSILVFLQGLAENNHKTWLEENKASYQSSKLIFEQFVANVLQSIQAYDSEVVGLVAKDCIFRMRVCLKF